MLTVIDYKLCKLANLETTKELFGTMIIFPDTTTNSVTVYNMDEINNHDILLKFDLNDLNYITDVYISPYLNDVQDVYIRNKLRHEFKLYIKQLEFKTFED